LNQRAVRRWLRANYPDDPTCPPPALLLDILYTTPTSLRFNGLDLLQLVRREFPEMLVFMSTVVDDPAVGVDVATQGAAGYFVKGSPPSQLARYLDATLTARWPWLELHQRITRLRRGCPQPLLTQIDQLRRGARAAEAGNPTAPIIQAKLAAMGENPRPAQGNWVYCYLRTMRNIVAHDWSHFGANCLRIPFQPTLRDAEIALRIALGHLENERNGTTWQFKHASWTDELHRKRLVATNERAKRHHSDCPDTGACQACALYLGTYRPSAWEHPFYFAYRGAGPKALAGRERYYERVVVPAVYLPWSDQDQLCSDSGQVRDRMLTELVKATALEQLLDWLERGLVLAPAVT